MAVEKILDSMKGEADLLRPIGNDVSWSTTTSYLPSAFPVLLFYPCLLSAGLACSCGVIAELRMCSERWVQRCPSQCCLTLASNNRKIKNWLSQIQDKDGLGLLPKLKLVHGWFACPVNGKKSEFKLLR